MDAILSAVNITANIITISTWLCGLIRWIRARKKR